LNASAFGATNAVTWPDELTPSIKAAELGAPNMEAAQDRDRCTGFHHEKEF
jgi:hypothetical protein